MNNRLEITPLVEENMNQMVDGEFAINQLNGHITYKKGDEYISKTKELNVEIIDKTMFKDDLVEKIDKDEEKLNGYKQSITEIEKVNAKLEQTLDSISKKLNTNEALVESLEEKLRVLDDNIINSLKDYQNLINNHINNNIKLLGSLMIESELLDRIPDNKSYFEKYVKNTWKYPDKQDIDHDYGTVSQNNENKIQMDLRVDKTTYDAEVSRIEAQYAKQGATYKIKGSL